jgi:hypothetical protein
MQYSNSSPVGCSMGRQGGPLGPCCGRARRCIQQGCCCSCCSELAVHLMPIRTAWQRSAACSCMDASVRPACFTTASCVSRVAGD